MKMQTSMEMQSAT